MTVTALSPSSPQLELEAGKVVGLVGAPGSGLTRLGFGLLRNQPGWVACIDVRGWLNPTVLWDMGVPTERVVVVRCPDSGSWPQVTATLVEGMGAVYAEVPSGVAVPMLRRLSALARARGTPVVLRPVDGDLPAGVTHLRLEAQEVEWAGAGEGRGRLRDRRFTLAATGKGVGGVRQLIEVEDDGSDTMRVVSRLAVAMPGRAVG